MTMPGPEKYFEQLRDMIRNEEDPKVIDQLLDMWLDTSNRATEYDGKMWGFDTERWMAEERDILASRATKDKSKTPGKNH